MRDAALVSTHREHKVVFCSLIDERTIASIEALDDIFHAETPYRRRLKPVAETATTVLRQTSSPATAFVAPDS